MILVNYRGQLLFTGGPINNPGLHIIISKNIQTALSAPTVISGEFMTAHPSILPSTIQNIIITMTITGTIDRPVTTFTSNPPGMRQSDILSYLALGTSTSGISSSKGAALIQTAKTLGANDLGIISDLQQTFGITEFGVTSEPFIDVHDNSVQQNTYFMIGKQLTPRIHLRYSTGLLIPYNIFRISYTISKRWLLQTETATEDNGADIFYTIEK